MMFQTDFLNELNFFFQRWADIGFFYDFQFFPEIQAEMDKNIANIQ
jgi:hypothetical protein